jgi:hypothetical protein
MRDFAVHEESLSIAPKKARALPGWKSHGYRTTAYSPSASGETGLCLKTQMQNQNKESRKTGNVKIAYSCLPAFLIICVLKARRSF